MWTIFKRSLFVFHLKNKHICVWNDMRSNKWLTNDCFFNFVSPFCFLFFVLFNQLLLFHSSDYICLLLVVHAWVEWLLKYNILFISWNFVKIMTWHNIPTVILLQQHYIGKLAVPVFLEYIWIVPNINKIFSYYNLKCECSHFSNEKN